MIRFILLLPLKIIGLLFMAIGATLDGVNRRRIEQEKQLEKRRREQCKIERAARIATERSQRSARIEKERREKAAEKERAQKFKAAQAATDMEHYKIQRAELIKLYSELEKQFDAAGTDKQKEVVFRKQIALNNQIRGVDRQIEKAQYTINKSGPA